MKKIFALLLIIPLMSFCNKPEPDPEPTPDPEDKAAIVINTQGDVVVDYAGGTGTISFTSNRDWTTTVSEDWLTVSPASGKASKDPITVTVTCETNNTTSTRDTYVVIVAENEKKPVRIFQGVNPYAGASQELKSGASLLATNPNVEKFLNEVEYPDKDWSYTKVLDYYGGFNGKTYNEAGQEDPNGKMFTWGYQPDSDKPMSYSIRWTESDLDGDNDMVILLEDSLGWKSETAISSGSLYVNITNLVPNDSYTYKVSSEGGKVITQGNFTTTGSLHQVFFKSGCRNARDLGGWKTVDGKTVKYRKIYRGGRMQSETVSNAGKKEILAEGIGGQLDLRGKSDVLTKPCIEGMEFCAPVIEQGGKSMLVNDAKKTKQCFEFVVNCLRNDKPVYFHCSLGRDRTGTFDILLLGLLGVREGDIGKAYEVTYFAPVGYSVSSSESGSNPTPIFKNTRCTWVYSDVVPYFWSLSTDGTFADGVEKYLLTVAGVSQKDIDDFRSMMLY